MEPANLSECSETPEQQSVYWTVFIDGLVILLMIVGTLFLGTAVCIFFYNWRSLSQNLVNWLSLGAAVANLTTLFMSGLFIVVYGKDCSLLYLIYHNDSGAIPAAMKVTFTAARYSLAALGIERYLIVAIRRDKLKLYRYEAAAGLSIVLLIWTLSFCSVLLTTVFSLSWYGQYVLVFSVILPITISNAFLTATACVLFRGTPSELESKRLKARYRTGKLLVVFVVFSNICVIPFVVVSLLTYWPLLDGFFCTQIGRALVEAVFTLCSCVIPCKYPLLLFAVSNKYRQCVRRMVGVLRRKRGL